MLAIHWTPVNETKKILKNGIRKSKNGLYCFPLTGIKHLDKWWVLFFNQARVRSRKKYNGIVFKLTEDDFPAYFGHWIGATNRHRNIKKDIPDLKSLKKEYREVLLWRMGEAIANERGMIKSLDDLHRLSDSFVAMAEQEIKANRKALAQKMNYFDFMEHSLNDYQIILSRSIGSERILKVLPQGDEFGRVIKKRKMNTRSKPMVNEVEE